MSAFRRLYKIDADLLRDHLLRLDGDSRYARFSGITSDATIRKYVDGIDWDWSKLIGYVHDGLLRAVAEIRFEKSAAPSEAELAFSVEKAFQNTRIGSSLMSRSLIVLRNRGVATAHVVCLLSNARMQKLALRHRADVKAYSGDVFMSIQVPYGDLGSLLSEVTDEYIGWMNTGLDLAWRMPISGMFLGAQRPEAPRPGTWP